MMLTSSNIGIGRRVMAGAEKVKRKKEKVGEYAFGTGAVTSSPSWSSNIGMPVISRPDLGLGPGATGLPALGLRPSHTGASFRRAPRFYYQGGTDYAGLSPAQQQIYDEVMGIYGRLQQDPIPRVRGRQYDPGLVPEAWLPGTGNVFNPGGGSDYPLMAQRGTSQAFPDITQDELGTQDTVPAMLSPGEAVLTPGAAEEVGRPKIRALNARNPPQVSSNSKTKTVPGRLAKRQRLIPPGMPVMAQGGIGYVPPQDTSLYPPGGGQVTFSGGLSPYQVQMMRQMRQRQQQQSAAMSPGGLANLLGLFSGTPTYGEGSSVSQALGPALEAAFPAGYQGGSENVEGAKQAIIDRINSGQTDYTFGPGSPNPTREDLGTYVGGPNAPAGGFAVEGGVALPPNEYNLFTPEERQALGIMDIAPANQAGQIERYYGGNVPAPAGAGQLVSPGSVPSVPYQLPPLPGYVSFLPGGQYAQAGRTIFNLGSQAGSALKNLFRDRGGGTPDVGGTAAGPGSTDVGGPGYTDASYYLGLGYQPGQGVGSLWPGPSPGAGPLPGSFAGLGSFSPGNLGSAAEQNAMFHSIWGGRNPMSYATWSQGAGTPEAWASMPGGSYGNYLNLWNQLQATPVTGFGPRVGGGPPAGGRVPTSPV